MDLGLFDVIICGGPVELLDHVKQHLEDKITSTLKTIANSEIQGLIPVWSDAPSVFTVVTGGSYQ